MTQRSKRAGAFLLGNFLLLGLAYLFRGPILTQVANLWIQDDDRSKADAIVVLGGGLCDRPQAAARLFHAGYAPTILVTRPGPRPSGATDNIFSEAETARSLLIANGVPESAITFVGDGVANTFQESQAVKEWARGRGARSVLIPTEFFHTRRVRWIFQKTLKKVGANAAVVSIQVRDYKPSNWWQNEGGVVCFSTELFKLAYYRFKY